MISTLTIVTAYAALVTVLFGVAAAVICLQWRRIGRLGQRIHDQHDAAIDQTILLQETQAECDRLRADNTVIRAENVRHLRLAVTGKTW